MAPSPQRLSVTRRAWPLARPFAISRGSKTTAEVVVAEIFDGDVRGRGECVPYPRYGESVDSVVGTLEDMRGAVFSGLDRKELQQAMPPGAARSIVGDALLIGLSCHSPEQLDAAPGEADYVTAGPIHATPTKPGRPGTGLEVVRHAATTVRRPWFAIGGIDPGTLPEAVEAGAARIAVVRAVTEAPDPAAAVRDLVAAFP